jgi:hypothetical protein
VAAQAGERGSLAQDWADQVFNSDALFADGSQLADFKQVLQKSRAVELLVDGCLSKGAFPFEAEPLAALLSAVAHPSVPRDYCQALATATCALGAVSATDPLAPAPAAKRSAAAALALALKGIPKPPPSKPAEAPAAKLKRLGGELGRQEARLPSTSAPKELCKVYASILELLCSQLDVLRPGGGAAAPHVPELAAALKPLDELRSALEARLQARWGGLVSVVAGLVYATPALEARLQVGLTGRHSVLCRQLFPSRPAQLAVLPAACWLTPGAPFCNLISPCCSPISSPC